MTKYSFSFPCLQGCTQQAPRHLISDHDVVCPYEPLPCPLCPTSAGMVSCQSLSSHFQRAHVKSNSRVRATRGQGSTLVRIPFNVLGKQNHVLVGVGEKVMT